MSSADSADCAHEGLHWFASPHDERGWRCVDCDWRPGEEPGFSPQHDRSHLATKVGGILHDLADAKIISISNASEADSVIVDAAFRCAERKLYDSESIALVILEIVASERHAKFWREIGEGIIAGRDPRPRCFCGKLSTISVMSDGNTDRFCSFEHEAQVTGRKIEDPF